MDLRPHLVRRGTLDLKQPPAVLLQWAGLMARPPGRTQAVATPAVGPQSCPPCPPPCNPRQVRPQAEPRRQPAVEPLLRWRCPPHLLHSDGRRRRGVRRYYWPCWREWLRNVAVLAKARGVSTGTLFSVVAVATLSMVGGDADTESRQQRPLRHSTTQYCKVPGPSVAPAPSRAHTREGDQ